jgi:hypothetical protein
MRIEEERNGKNRSDEERKSIVYNIITVMYNIIYNNIIII